MQKDLPRREIFLQFNNIKFIVHPSMKVETVYVTFIYLVIIIIFLFLAAAGDHSSLCHNPSITDQSAFFVVSVAWTSPSITLHAGGRCWR